MIYSLYKCILLIASGCATLNPERFLNDYHVVDQIQAEQGVLKAKLTGFLHAARCIRTPLIFLNTFTVFLIVLLNLSQKNVLRLCSPLFKCQMVCRRH